MSVLFVSVRRTATGAGFLDPEHTMHASPRIADRSRRTVEAGFTLIEIMVVVAIIGILASIGLVVGRRVTESSRASLTRDLLRTMDQGLSAYGADRDGNAPSVYRDANGNEAPVLDGRIGGDAAPTTESPPVENSLGLLLLATKQDAGLVGTIQRMDAKFVSNSTFPSQAPNFVQVKVPLVKDAWGNQIRFVHPKFHGGFGVWNTPAGAAGPARPILQATVKQAGGGSTMIELRRSFRPYTGSGAGDVGDADEGLCTGGRPYFYSPGPDKDPGTRSDNVYMDAPPQFPTETARYQ